MDIYDRKLPLPPGTRPLAEQVEWIEANGSCSEETAALLVLTKILKDIDSQLKCLTSAIEAQREEEKK